ncbi:MAG: sigma 54-interacting transcriptional regulator [Sandaracinaceae bacterium]|nr:sigma 54-interacting transcriptional regulator [Sandaracinaceae bacterium]
MALSDAPVLLRGESGTGKELVARAIHEASPRKGAAYVSENVSAIPETLLESALFGHVRGAFTGAERARRGLFEIADGGTLFLDEIGEMSEPLQAKLLRVLQDGELRPIGSEEARRVDVRVVTATHRDLEAMVASGRFREDLFYRIAVVQVELPPLRQRPEDVAPLVAELLERHAPGRRVRVDRAAMSALRAYAWPGNVRQLENELRRALVLCDDLIEPGHLSPVVRGEGGPGAARRAGSEGPDRLAGAPSDPRRARADLRQSDPRRRAPRALALRPRQDDEAPRPRSAELTGRASVVRESHGVVKAPTAGGSS